MFAALAGSVVRCMVPQLMILEIAIRYLHFLGIITLGGAIPGQAVLLRPRLERGTIATLMARGIGLSP